MNCPNCGNALPNGAAFCPSCGQKTAQPIDPMTALVNRARAGDQAAIAALYEQSYQPVYFTVRALIKDEDAAFDVLLDAYMKAFSHLDRFQGGE